MAAYRNRSRRELFLFFATVSESFVRVSLKEGSHLFSQKHMCNILWPDGPLWRCCKRGELPKAQAHRACFAIQYVSSFLAAWSIFASPRRPIRLDVYDRNNFQSFQCFLLYFAAFRGEGKMWFLVLDLNVQEKMKDHGDSRACLRTLQ